MKDFYKFLIGLTIFAYIVMFLRVIIIRLGYKKSVIILLDQEHNKINAEYYIEQLHLHGFSLVGYDDNTTEMHFSLENNKAFPTEYAFSQREVEGLKSDGIHISFK